jgi:Spy/CpxP family protein refolding chaperone
MKKLIVVLSMLCTVNISFAQIRREVPVTNSGADSSQKISKRMMMDELNLTKAQRVQMKQIQQNNKAQKESIMNNDSLTTDQKKMMLKELHKQTANDINTILTDEQREKMKEIKQENRAIKQNNLNNSIQDSSRNNMEPEN